MRSELAFRSARVAIASVGDFVALTLTLPTGKNITAMLGADGAALVGCELERAAHYVQRTATPEGKPA